MLNSLRHIVEVEILDKMNRPKKKRILGVWKDLNEVPFDLIRRANNVAYPGCEVNIKVTPYEGP